MKPSKVAQHAVYGAVLLPYIVFGLIRVYRGIVIGDEGWYLLAAANVLEGKVPYADFLFTQMPLVPYFYAAFVLLLGKSLIAVRWVSLCLGRDRDISIARTGRLCWCTPDKYDGRYHGNGDISYCRFDSRNFSGPTSGEFAAGAGVEAVLGDV